MIGESEASRFGPFEEGRFLEESIDDYALEGRRFSIPPLKQEFEKVYGDRGVGWDVVRRVPHTPAEMLAQNMGLVVLDVVISPKGDEHAVQGGYL